MQGRSRRIIVLNTSDRSRTDDDRRTVRPMAVHVALVMMPVVTMALDTIPRPLAMPSVVMMMTMYAVANDNRLRRRRDSNANRRCRCNSQSNFLHSTSSGNRSVC
jgi:hypothetical protein